MPGQNFTSQGGGNYSGNVATASHGSPSNPTPPPSAVHVATGGAVTGQNFSGQGGGNYSNIQAGVPGRETVTYKEAGGGVITTQVNTGAMRQTIERPTPGGGMVTEQIPATAPLPQGAISIYNPITAMNNQVAASMAINKPISSPSVQDQMKIDYLQRPNAEWANPNAFHAAVAEVQPLLTPGKQYNFTGTSVSPDPRAWLPDAITGAGIFKGFQTQDQFQYPQPGIPYAPVTAESMRQNYINSWWAGLSAPEKVLYGAEAIGENLFSMPIDAISARLDFSKVSSLPEMAYNTMTGAQSNYQKRGYAGGFGATLIGNQAFDVVAGGLGGGFAIGLLPPKIAAIIGIGMGGAGVYDIGSKVVSGDIKGAATEGAMFAASLPFAMIGTEAGANFAGTIGRLNPFKGGTIKVPASFTEPSLGLGNTEDILMVRSGSSQILLPPSSASRSVSRSISSPFSTSTYDSPTDYGGKILQNELYKTQFDINQEKIKADAIDILKGMLEKPSTGQFPISDLFQGTKTIQGTKLISDLFSIGAAASISREVSIAVSKSESAQISESTQIPISITSQKSITKQLSETVLIPVSQSITKQITDQIPIFIPPSVYSGGDGGTILPPPPVFIPPFIPPSGGGGGIPIPRINIPEFPPFDGGGGGITKIKPPTLDFPFQFPDETYTRKRKKTHRPVKSYTVRNQFADLEDIINVIDIGTRKSAKKSNEQFGFKAPKIPDFDSMFGAKKPRKSKKRGK